MTALAIAAIAAAEFMHGGRPDWRTHAVLDVDWTHYESLVTWQIRVAELLGIVTLTDDEQAGLVPAAASGGISR